MNWFEVAAVVCLALGLCLLVGVRVARGGRSGGPGLKGGGDPAGSLPTVSPSAPAVPGVPVNDLLLPEDLQFHLYRELGNGRKIHAIKLVRQHTRLGLKEAKDIVDALEAGWRPPPQAGRPDGAGRAGPPSGRPDEVRSLSERVRDLERSGDHAAAIALVRAQTGMNAEEAERFVAALG